MLQGMAVPVETFKPVVGFEGLYEVGDHGAVRTVARVVRCDRGLRALPRETLAQTLGGRAMNYKRVQLKDGLRRRFAYVHHLIAEAFIGPRPDGMQVCHIDDNGFNNVITNLTYGDREMNEIDRHVARVAKYLPEAPF